MTAALPRPLRRAHADALAAAVKSRDNATAAFPALAPSRPPVRPVQTGPRPRPTSRLRRDLGDWAYTCGLLSACVVCLTLADQITTLLGGTP